MQHLIVDVIQDGLYCFIISQMRKDDTPIVIHRSPYIYATWREAMAAGDAWKFERGGV